VKGGSEGDGGVYFERD